MKSPPNNSGWKMKIELSDSATRNDKKIHFGKISFSILKNLNILNIFCDQANFHCWPNFEQIVYSSGHTVSDIWYYRENCIQISQRTRELFASTTFMIQHQVFLDGPVVCFGFHQVLNLEICQNKSR